MHKKRLLLSLLFLGVSLYAMGVGTYFILRFAGHWNEGDTARLSQAVKYIHHMGRLVPDAPGPIYPYGPTYPALSTFLLEITNTSPPTLMLHVYPLTVALIAFIGFALYRVLTGDASVALLATLFLYLQPDFLWVTFRGSHEKVTWSLVLLAFLLLARSFTARGRIEKLVRFVLLFYLVAFALIATNVFFASSFIAALSLGFLGGSLLFALRETRKTWGPESKPQVRRLLYVTSSCCALLYLVIFHVYPPANSTFRTLRTLLERLVALLLNIEMPFNPYEYVIVTWPNPWIYIALTLFNYMILLISFAVWVGGLMHFLKEGYSRLELPRFFLWLMYSAFALQLAMSVIMDRTGVAGGNFQVRLFTPMMLMAIPLASMGVLRAWSWLKPRPWRKAVVALAILLVSWFSLAALMKATNEPTLSNRWIFRTQAEQEAGAWIKRHIASAKIWVGMDERLLSAMEFSLYPHEGLFFDGWSIEPGTRYFLLSTFERLKYARLKHPLPYFEEENKVYDNGEVQLYHRRPRTPYQR